MQLWRPGMLLQGAPLCVPSTSRLHNYSLSRSAFPMTYIPRRGRPVDFSFFLPLPDCVKDLLVP